MLFKTVRRPIVLAIIIVLVGGTDLMYAQTDNSGNESTGDGHLSSPIQPSDENPWYWEYQGELVLLRGGTDDDNLFQWTGDKLTDHLDLLASVGGNYVRNTMSNRDENNVSAFPRTSDGLFDLEQWNQEYWDRLTFFLDETAKRGIIVQLTLWDQFDLGGPDDPWTGENNVNYSNEVIGGEEDFHNTIEEDNTEGLRYQKRYIDKLLSIAMSYDHVLYNINNESGEGAIWENYWGKYINHTAEAMSREAYVTTMRFDPSNAVRAAMTYDDIYAYADISQNNQDSRGARGQGHWDNIMLWRNKLIDRPMPLNNVKVYGGQDGVNYSAGTETEAVNRTWRNIFAGCASTRFHRPAMPRVWGSGLNERVQTNLKAMDMFLEEFDIFAASPHSDLIRHRVAAARSTVEAYVSADIGNAYAVYFPRGRYMIDLDPWEYVDKVKIRWLHIEELSWSEPEVVEVRWDGDRSNWGDRGRITLKTPGNEAYVALVEVVE